MCVRKIFYGIRRNTVACVEPAQSKAQRSRGPIQRPGPGAEYTAAIRSDPRDAAAWSNRARAPEPNRGAPSRTLSYHFPVESFAGRPHHFIPRISWRLLPGPGPFFSRWYTGCGTCMGTGRWGGVGERFPDSPTLGGWVAIGSDVSALVGLGACLRP